MRSWNCSPRKRIQTRSQRSDRPGVRSGWNHSCRGGPNAGCSAHYGPRSTGSVIPRRGCKHRHSACAASGGADRRERQRTAGGAERGAVRRQVPPGCGRSLLDQGTCLVSVSTMYRVLREEDQYVSRAHSHQLAPVMVSTLSQGSTTTPLVSCSPRSGGTTMTPPGWPNAVSAG